jgi:hypothetical protein
MCRRSQLLLFFCLKLCGLLAVTCSVQFAISPLNLAVPAARHATATFHQTCLADAGTPTNLVAEESSDAPDFKPLALLSGSVMERAGRAAGLLDICTAPLARDPSLVAQRIRLQI